MNFEFGIRPLHRKINLPRRHPSSNVKVLQLGALALKRDVAYSCAGTDSLIGTLQEIILLWRRHSACLSLSDWA